MKLSKVFGIVLSLHVGVILLVMFQPSCQTTGGKKNVTPDQEVAPEDSTTEQSFNEALKEETDEETSVTNEQKIDEFSSPQRPSPGELIIPVDSPAGKPSSPAAIIVPKDSPGQVIDLAPTDLAIYKVVRGDTLWGIARKNNVSLANLLKANPNLDKSGRLSIGQEIMIPGGQLNAVSIDNIPQTAPIPTTTGGGSSYTVLKGDTLSGIARKHGVRLSELLKFNGLSMSSIIRTGQSLSIPQGSEYLSISNPPSVQSRSTTVPAGATTHTVKKGENLSRIASIYGVSVTQIMEWNGLTNPSLVRAGQPLIVSQSSTINVDVPSPASVDNEIESVPADPGGSLQDFFNDSSSADRPIIDAP